MNECATNDDVEGVAAMSVSEVDPRHSSALIPKESLSVEGREFNRKAFLRSGSDHDFLACVSGRVSKSVDSIRYTPFVTDNLIYIVTATSDNVFHELDNIDITLDDCSAGQDVSSNLLAHLIFEKGETYSREPAWNMSHRWIVSKSFGISGSDFLAKAEHYLTLLNEAGLVNEKYIVASVAQLSMMSFLIKNGYEQEGERRFDIDDYFDVIDGDLVPKTGYYTVRLHDKDNGQEKDECIVSSEFVNDPQAEKWLSTIQRDGDGFMLLSEDTYRDLVFFGYIPKFKFIKKIA